MKNSKTIITVFLILATSGCVARPPIIDPSVELVAEKSSRFSEFEAVSPQLNHLLQANPNEFTAAIDGEDILVSDSYRAGSGLICRKGNTVQRVLLQEKTIGGAMLLCSEDGEQWGYGRFVFSSVNLGPVSGEER